MSEEQRDDWREMLRAIMGDDAADEVMKALSANGIDPQMGSIIDPANMTMITAQLQSMLGSSGDGAVNWKIAEEVARETVIRSHMDSLSTADANGARSALSVASLWLDVATDIDPNRGPNLAWSRLDWVAHSLPTFKKLMEPLGENISRAFGDVMSQQAGGLPPQLAGIIGDPSALISRMIASFLGMQYGVALAELAVGSFGSTDTGIPLVEGSSAALVPSNISAFSRDLEAEDSEILMYIAVRECAAARLYSSMPWLRARVIDTVAEFARGIEIDMSSIEEQVRSLNFDDPSGIQELDLSGVFVMEQSPGQRDAVARLEHLLSLIEGWVTTVSARAVLPHLPSSVALREMFVRRQATDHPAKAVWGAQLGVELAPRRLRDAATFWELATEKLGVDGRDNLWTHPDLLPTAEDLDDPHAFFSDESAQIEKELDSFLEDLFKDSSGNNAPDSAGDANVPGDDTDASDSPGDQSTDVD